MQLRRATLTDAPILCAFAEKTFRIAWQAQNDPEQFEAYCRAHFDLNNFEQEMLAQDAAFFVVEEGGDLVAYIKLNFNTLPEGHELPGGAVQLERIYVAPERQGGGMGAQLMQFYEQQAMDAGAAWVWLSVWDRSPRSIAFYEKNGYEIFGTEVFMVGNDAQRDYLMRKTTRINRNTP